ncbi:hypothetical protein E4U19_006636 [Claviceps sp. Clav32 group G5]|nr:hypothetical protein E4U19_006636 [Claviceps sp. Clav32 group G5]KAG6041933.1 hypothetical protein E4U39_006256 [Claviceps sp. Clav50 group G5]
MEDPCGEDDWVSKNVLVLREALTKPDLAHFTKAVFTLEYTDHKLFRERTRITKSMKKSAKKLDEESAKESDVN